MSDLGDDARGFLATARGVHDAPPGAKERVRAGLAVGLGVAAGASAVGTTIRAGSSGAGLAVVKVALVVAILGGGVALLVARNKATGAPSSASTALTIASSAIPANAPTLPEPPASVALVDAPLPSSSAAVVAPAPRSSYAPSARAAHDADSDGSVAAEVALLRKVSAALRAGDPKSALAGADEHARRFPNGALSEERDMERILALCALDRRDEAARATERFSRAYPSSSHGARIHAACAAPAPTWSVTGPFAVGVTGTV